MLMDAEHFLQLIAEIHEEKCSTSGSKNLNKYCIYQQ